ncbi:MAG: hypothetical protein M3N48_00940, partial [Verrucomicrobiota bacterium]|nr:hypothetical protein [Verrucomicrobiota bacterium]
VYPGQIDEYTTSGQTIKIGKIIIEGDPVDVAVSGQDLFVLIQPRRGEPGPSTVGKFTTEGETVNTAFITLPFQGNSFVVSDGKIFVGCTDSTNGRIIEYTTSGDVVNDALITGTGLFAIQGDRVFAARPARAGEPGGITISQYTTSGATVNATLITGLQSVMDIGISDGHLFLLGGEPTVRDSSGRIDEYDATSGALIKGTLIGNLAYAPALSIVPHSDNTNVGSNVTLFPSSNASVTFSNVTAPGGTSVVAIDPSSAGSPPSGYDVNGGLAYEIHTTATVVPPIEVCFHGPFSTGGGTISPLRVLHRENGVLVDRTYRLDFSPGGGQVCARVDSLSPFVLATTAAPFVNPASQLLNISTRLSVQLGDKAMIGGFILTGKDPKQVMIRGIGPSLTAFGVPGALQNPILELHDSTGAIIATNDDWKTDQNKVELTGIAPTDNRESAIVTTLPANGAGYTAIVRGNNNTTGVGLVEVYDLSEIANSKAANISTRGFVDAGDNAMIGGFILGGGGNGKVVVRAIGPTLVNFGVSGSLQDPTLELHDGNGALLVFNDNWQQDSAAAEIQANKLAPNDPRESAVLRSLAPGAYTAIVRGKDNTTGVGLVEVYNVQ